jgi:nucleoid-associated protein YgaU
VIVVPGARGYIPYLVQKGDNLTKILREHAGDPKVSNVKNTPLASGLKNPDKIFPGQLLRIPV